jgi:hypothetical protein
LSDPQPPLDGDEPDFAETIKWLGGADRRDLRDISYVFTTGGAAVGRTSA